MQLCYPLLQSNSAFSSNIPDNNRVFSHDVTAAILVFQNNKTVDMMVLFQTNPVGVDLFSYVNTFFCVNKFAYMQMLVT